MLRLREALPAIETTVTVTAGVCIFVALLCTGVVAAWSIGLYLWLVTFMTPTQAAFLLGFVLLALAVAAVVIGRIVIRDKLGGRTPAKRDGANEKYEAVACALEAVGGMAKGKPFSALLTALALGVASGYLADDN
jgi:hypothetical protein